LLEAAQDPRAFLRAHFTLTPAQEQEIAAISQPDMAALQNYLRSAANERQPVSVAINKSAPTPTQAGVPWCNAPGYCVSNGSDQPAVC